MFSWISNAWRVPELRKRVLFTALVLALYRLGSWIPAPGVNSDQIKQYFSGQGGTILGLLNVFSGGALSQFCLFALGIMPYVTASIILQLLTVVIPKLEELQKEGESGYAKINSEIPLPIPRLVISSPMYIRSVVPAVSVMMIRTSRPELAVSAPWRWKRYA